MTDEEIKRVIDQLKTDNPETDALFDINFYGGGPDESFIKANKQGLQLFAAELLQGSIESKKIIEDKEKNIIPLNHTNEWVNGDVLIDYIEPTFATRQKPEEPKKKNKLKHKLIGIGLSIFLLFLVICLIVGFVTIVKDINQ